MLYKLCYSKISIKNIFSQHRVKRIFTLKFILTQIRDSSQNRFDGMLMDLSFSFLMNTCFDFPLDFHWICLPK